MLNHKLIDLHAHLWYEESSIFLLEKLSKAWDGPITISFNDNGPNNKDIEKKAKSLFPKVIPYVYTNRGTDQYGFYKATRETIKDDKKWTFSCHDKNPKKMSFLDDTLDPIINNSEAVNKYIEDETVGMIASELMKRKIDTEEDLISHSKYVQFDLLHNVVQAKHTLSWIRELQYLLFNKHKMINKEHVNFDFAAGNIFLIKNDVLKLSQSCVHENWFPTYYRTDGDVSHGLERFYFYVSICMNYENVYI